MKVILFFILLFFSSNLFAEASKKEAHGYASKVIEKTFKIIKDNKNSKQFKSLLESSFLKEIDTKWSCRAIAGQLWSQMTKEQTEKFNKGCYSFLLNFWLQKFQQYTNETYSILDNIENIDDKNFLSTIVLHTNTNNQPKDINLNIRIKYKDGEYKIVNANVEGIDMIRSYNNQFNDYADKNGIEKLLEYLLNFK